MLPVERRQFILDELYKNKAVAVNELAQQLGVTTMTIRRDLQLLEDNGLVEKSHGGAVLTESLIKEATYHNRKLVRIQEKRQIAEAALPLIESSMSIYLDAGTTNYELAELIAKKRWDGLTVVTNDLAIAQVLMPAAGLDVIMLGGYVDEESGSTCGALATNMVRQMHFDLNFRNFCAMAQLIYDRIRLWMPIHIVSIIIDHFTIEHTHPAGWIIDGIPS